MMPGGGSPEARGARAVLGLKPEAAGRGPDEGGLARKAPRGTRGCLSGERASTACDERHESWPGKSPAPGVGLLTRAPLVRTPMAASGSNPRTALAPRARGGKITGSPCRSGLAGKRPGGLPSSRPWALCFLTAFHLLCDELSSFNHSGGRWRAEGYRNPSAKART